MELGKPMNHLVRDSIFNSTQYKLYYIVRNAVSISQSSQMGPVGTIQDRVNLSVYMHVYLEVWK